MSDTNNSSSASGGIGVFGLVQAVLIIAKFIDQPWNKAYDIPWVWVFTPVYVCVTLVFVVMVIVLIGVFLAEK